MLKYLNESKTSGGRAVEYVRNGMNIALGTGSTVYWTIRRLGASVKAGLQIRAIPTSEATANLMREFGILLITFADVSKLDLTIDGADEISLMLDLSKGGALRREKIVAAAAEQLVIVADESKLADSLGKFPLPIEIVPFGWETTRRRGESLNCEAILRTREGEIFLIDDGNFILNCAFGAIENPAKLNCELKLLNGVVETGLFVAMAKTAIVAGKKQSRNHRKSFRKFMNAGGSFFLFDVDNTLLDNDRVTGFV